MFTVVIAAVWPDVNSGENNNKPLFMPIVCWEAFAQFVRGKTQPEACWGWGVLRLLAGGDLEAVELAHCQARRER